MLCIHRSIPSDEQQRLKPHDEGKNPSRVFSHRNDRTEATPQELSGRRRRRRGREQTPPSPVRSSSPVPTASSAAYRSAFLLLRAQLRRPPPCDLASSDPSTSLRPLHPLSGSRRQPYPSSYSSGIELQASEDSSSSRYHIPLFFSGFCDVMRN